ncbi:GNAT family N-acetyltransferase [Cytobacillus purgationiresistens]|uniref:Ribosomal protein S18 acetylase RimI-like enzyme n=1 Tax=Cytobacillus purgationiresistens TaxID=863449 RepID=A0ABU0AK00_9BACI|nr:GNAT family N-acetyltransferase [Cytobacillus purgationiresistens]MDQ0271591.1 ribosomal protein S18 acetylase RimI-like enzyme [Cytobacillus purgationiresistens]
MNLRLVRPEDYYEISRLINDWWGGRKMSDMLPKLFFDHFNDTSYIVEKDEVIIGFLIGFVSQTKPNEAYIHFVGVHPEYRKNQVGKKLYHTFFENVKRRSVKIVRAVTSPVNKTSIAYHTRMGFEVEQGDRTADGVSVFSNYDGLGQDRVLFLKIL